MTVQRPIRNAFTVDVEDYFQVSAFARTVSTNQWDSHESRVVESTRRLLHLLQKHSVRGTFFVLGWVAERFPGLVREIAGDGHELGCHSYWHRLVYDQTPDEFRADLRLAKTAIENAAGVAVTAYRAPSFSITQKSLWALDVLCEEGFTLDSSLFPVRHDRYGVPGGERLVHTISTEHGDLCEFPPSIYRAGRYSLPIGGGGYFRLYPYRATESFLKSTQRATGAPFMFYIHPWEVDPGQPRLAAPALTRARHYVNLKHTEAKLDRLLAAFSFGSVGEALADHRARLGAAPLPVYCLDPSRQRLERTFRSANFELASDDGPLERDSAGAEREMAGLARAD